MSKNNDKFIKALWNRDELTPEGGFAYGAPEQREGLNDKRAEFFYNMMSENLEHARHVENERITFNSIFIALAAGVLAFVWSIPEAELTKAFQVGLLCVLLLLEIIAFLLTIRWNSVFDRHMSYAKSCYLMVRQYLFGNVTEDDNYSGDNTVIKNGRKIDEGEMDCFKELPAFCFSPKYLSYIVSDEGQGGSNAASKKKSGISLLSRLKTKMLFNTFYIMLAILIVGSIIAVIISGN